MIGLVKVLLKIGDGIVERIDGLMKIIDKMSGVGRRARSTNITGWNRG